MFPSQHRNRARMSFPNAEWNCWAPERQAMRRGFFAKQSPLTHATSRRTTALSAHCATPDNATPPWQPPSRSPRSPQQTRWPRPACPSPYNKPGGFRKRRPPRDKRAFSNGSSSWQWIPPIFSRPPPIPNPFRLDRFQLQSHDSETLIQGTFMTRIRFAGYTCAAGGKRHGQIRKKAP